jgi:hypothetical protein
LFEWLYLSLVECFNDYLSVDECLMTISAWMMYQLWESHQFCGGQTTPGRLSRGACSSFEVEQARQEHLREERQNHEPSPCTEAEKDHLAMVAGTY